jgi:Heterokaryon incompatibility protein (HET)
VNYNQDTALFLLATLFWIVAICFDQANTLERNHQVNDMGDIKQANCAIVRPGAAEEEDGSPVSLCLIHDGEICNLSNHLSAPQSRVRLLELCSKPYWSRLWVEQEALLAKRILVIKG